MPTPLCRLVSVATMPLSVRRTLIVWLPSQYSAWICERGALKLNVQCAGCMTASGAEASVQGAGLAFSTRTLPAGCGNESADCNHAPIAFAPAGGGSGSASCVLLRSAAGCSGSTARWFSQTPLKPNSRPSVAPHRPIQPWVLRSQIVTLARACEFKCRSIGA